MRIIILTIFLFGTVELFAQDSTSFDFWERNILLNKSFETMRSSLQNNQFEVTNNKADIPSSLIELLNNTDFANPNEDYQATDFIDDELLPSRQIMLLAKTSNQILLTYKHGGIGHHHHLLWCELTNNKVTDLWIGVTFKEMHTINDVIRIIETDPKKLNTNMVCK